MESVLTQISPAVLKMAGSEVQPLTALEVKWLRDEYPI